MWCQRLLEDFFLDSCVRRNDEGNAGMTWSNTIHDVLNDMNWLLYMYVDADLGDEMPHAVKYQTLETNSLSMRCFNVFFWHVDHCLS